MRISRTSVQSGCLTLVLVAAIIIPTGNSWARERKVCANGKVTYELCPEGLTTSPPTQGPNKTPTRPRAKSGPISYGSIVAPEFAPLSDSLGHWKGYIRGAGILSLYLQLTKGGIPVETRFMGNVKVSLKEKPTRFNFTTATPSKGGWGWRLFTRRIG